MQNFAETPQINFFVYQNNYNFFGKNFREKEMEMVLGMERRSITSK